MNTKKIGENLAALMKARHISQSELSKTTGISQATIKHHRETGKMDTEYLERYCTAIGCTMAELTADVIDIEKFSLEKDISSWYPWNLAIAVSGVEVYDADGNITDEAKAEMYSVYIPELLKSVESLTEREKKVLNLRFVNGLTYEQCGYRFNVTRERIRQVEAKALRRLRHPRYFKHWHYDTLDKYIEAKEESSRYQLENIMLKDKLKSIAKMFDAQNGDLKVPELKKNPLDISIDEMELSVRSYNCLKRGGINKISDMEGFTMSQFMKIRNLGRKSIVEIVKKLEEYGIEIEDDT